MTVTDVPTEMHLRVSGSGEQHHDADHCGVDPQNNGRIDRVIEIRLFHRGIALADAAVIALFHVVFQTERVDGADVV